MVALLVAPACSHRSADQAKRDADAAVDAGKVAADKVAETTREVATATGAAVSDGWITAKLKAKFADEVVLNGSDISVETNDHTVTLKRIRAVAGCEIARGRNRHRHRRRPAGRQSARRHVVSQSRGEFMEWAPGDRDNIEDRRGSSGMRTAVPIGIGGLLVLGLLSWVTGTDFLSLADRSGVAAGRGLRRPGAEHAAGRAEGRLRRRRRPRRAEHVRAGARRPLRADARRTVPRRHPVGVRVGRVGDRTVLLPG